MKTHVTATYLVLMDDSFTKLTGLLAATDWSEYLTFSPGLPYISRYVPKYGTPFHEFNALVLYLPIYLRQLYFF